jgi:hypothetical protein
MCSDRSRRADRDVESECRLLRQSRRIPARLPERLQGDARFAIAISVTFPLFLIVREMRVSRTAETRLSAVDTAALAVLSVVMVGLTIWVGMG